MVTSNVRSPEMLLHDNIHVEGRNVFGLSRLRGAEWVACVTSFGVAKRDSRRRPAIIASNPKSLQS